MVIGLGCSAFALSSYGSGGISSALLESVFVPDVAAIPVRATGFLGPDVTAITTERALLFAPIIPESPKCSPSKCAGMVPYTNNYVSDQSGKACDEDDFGCVVRDDFFSFSFEQCKTACDNTPECGSFRNGTLEDDSKICTFASACTASSDSQECKDLKMTAAKCWDMQWYFPGIDVEYMPWHVGAVEDLGNVGKCYTKRCPPPPEPDCGRGDDPNYLVLGWNCVAWSGYTCGGWGLNARQVSELQRACPNACADVNCYVKPAPSLPPFSPPEPGCSLLCPAGQEECWAEGEKRRFDEMRADNSWSALGEGSAFQACTVLAAQVFDVGVWSEFGNELRQYNEQLTKIRADGTFEMGVANVTDFCQRIYDDCVGRRVGREYESHCGSGGQMPPKPDWDSGCGGWMTGVIATTQSQIAADNANGKVERIPMLTAVSSQLIKGPQE